MRSHLHRIRTGGIGRHHVLPLLLLVAAALAVIAFSLVESGREEPAPDATRLEAVQEAEPSTTASTVAGVKEAANPGATAATKSSPVCGGVARQPEPAESGGRLQFKSSYITDEEVRFYSGVDACINLSGADARMGCLEGLGLKPVMECENRSSGRIDCYNYYSMQDRCSDLCQLLDPFSKRECFLGCAVNLKNPALCDYAYNDYRKLQCLGFSAAEAQNKSVCEALPGNGSFTGSVVYNRDFATYKDLCFAAIAVTKNSTNTDAADCELVQDPQMRIYCTALVKNDTRLCMQITDDFRRLKCETDMPIVHAARSMRNFFFPDRLERPCYAMYLPKELRQQNDQTILRIW